MQSQQFTACEAQSRPCMRVEVVSRWLGDGEHPRLSRPDVERKLRSMATPRSQLISISTRPANPRTTFSSSSTVPRLTPNSGLSRRTSFVHADRPVLGARERTPHFAGARGGGAHRVDHSVDHNPNLEVDCDAVVACGPIDVRAWTAHDEVISWRRMSRSAERTLSSSYHAPVLSTHCTGMWRAGWLRRCTPNACVSDEFHGHE